MDSIYQQYKKCGVKIITEVGGGLEASSGFLYTTSPKSQYNYVFTTKHTFKESADDNEMNMESIAYIEIQYFQQESFKKYEYINQRLIAKRMIEFDSDLVLILVKKNNLFKIPRIQVSDSSSKTCMAWSMTSARNTDLLPLELKKMDSEVKRYTIQGWSDSKYLKGCSGSGILSSDKPILHGFIMQYPTEQFQGNYIDAVNISFEEINNKLFDKRLEELSTEDSRNRRIVNEILVVDLNEAVINGVKLDLQLARKRVLIDSVDDWFHDPLNFIDLSNEDFLFEYFGDYFGFAKYKVSESEVFYLPKKSFTLRKAMVIQYADRVYYAALVEIIGKRLDNALCPMIFSARFNNLKNNGIMISGVEQWKKMQYQLKDYSFQYKYVIEIDILNYYDNININLLCNKISAVCLTENERNATKELRKTLAIFSNDKPNGIPQNSDVSSLLATFISIK